MSEIYNELSKIQTIKSDRYEMVYESGRLLVSVKKQNQKTISV